MKRFIVRDTSPLGLLCQRADIQEAEECREWAASVVARGDSVIVPEIATYEIRRELLRKSHVNALRKLADFIAADSERFLPINSAAMTRAAELWAEVRRSGKPTADRHALDGDVILAAQALTAGFPADFIIATSNVAHLSLFVPAEQWSKI